MEKTKILIVDQDSVTAEYFKRAIKLILPTSEIDIALANDDISIIQKEKSFNVIILDSREALNQIPKENYGNVVVCSKDHNFVLESIKEARTKIILRTADFYDGIYRFFALRNLI